MTRATTRVRSPGVVNREGTASPSRGRVCSGVTFGFLRGLRPPGRRERLMKKFGGKFALIIGLTLLGLISVWPPKDKLKTGIDLSGGTILVYEINASNTASGSVNLGELITQLKRRINPEGVEDIAIRQVGNNRIEIVL